MTTKDLQNQLLAYYKEQMEVHRNYFQAQVVLTKFYNRASSMIHDYETKNQKKLAVTIADLGLK